MEHRSGSRRRVAPALVAVALGFAALAGCTRASPPPASPLPAATPSPTSSPSEPAPEPEPSPTVTTPEGPATVVVTQVRLTAEDVARGLDAPWGIAGLPGGGLLVSLRDEARLVVVDPATGAVADVTGPGADELRANTVPRSEAGLLGVAVGPPDSSAPGEVFVYRTGRDGNEVLRGRLDGAVLSALTPILRGIPAAGNHDGGRLAFGPDGALYVSTGDAQQTERAQDPASLGGKILRVTVDGAPAPGNPDAASLVWSLGHRNVQGIGWDATGRMLASEFGQNTFDELNVIVPGGNYGWPDVEGAGGADAGFVEPVATWGTDEASPSGIAVTREGVYLAALRGQRLWRVPFAAAEGQSPQDAPLGFAESQVVLDGQGRLRAVIADPSRPPSTDGSAVLYVLTNNTDGRGNPREGDDRLLRVTIAPG